jgi:hypothetical protein
VEMEKEVKNRLAEIHMILFENHTNLANKNAKSSNDCILNILHSNNILSTIKIITNQSNILDI